MLLECIHLTFNVTDVLRPPLPPVPQLVDLTGGSPSRERTTYRFNDELITDMEHGPLWLSEHFEHLAGPEVGMETVATAVASAPSSWLERHAKVELLAALHNNPQELCSLLARSGHSVAVVVLHIARHLVDPFAQYDRMTFSGCLDKVAGSDPRHQTYFSGSSSLEKLCRLIAYYGTVSSSSHGWR
jgi:hypothetical protein